jgi:hypothetical protein
MRFWTLSSIPNTTQRFGIQMCFRPRVKTNVDVACSVESIRRSIVTEIILTEET